MFQVTEFQVMDSFGVTGTHQLSIDSILLPYHYVQKNPSMNLLWSICMILWDKVGNAPYITLLLDEIVLKSKYVHTWRDYK